MYCNYLILWPAGPLETYLLLLYSPSPGQPEHCCSQSSVLLRMRINNTKLWQSHQDLFTEIKWAGLRGATDSDKVDRQTSGEWDRVNVWMIGLWYYPTDLLGQLRWTAYQWNNGENRCESCDAREGVQWQDFSSREVPQWEVLWRQQVPGNHRSSLWSQVKKYGEIESNNFLILKYF